MLKIFAKCTVTFYHSKDLDREQKALDIVAHLDAMLLVPVRVEAVVDDGGFGNAAATLAVRTGVHRHVRVRHIFRVSVTIKINHQPSFN